MTRGIGRPLGVIIMPERLEMEEAEDDDDAEEIGWATIPLPKTLRGLGLELLL